MTKPFDTTTRDLLDGYPVPWMIYLGLVREGPVQVIDSALGTVVAEADKVYHVGGPHPYLIHIELQARGDVTLPRRAWRYNSLLDLRHGLRVLSVVVQLRPEAETSNLTGVLDLRLPDGSPIVQFHYRIVRPWEQPLEPLLAGSLGTLPMAPLANVSDERVSDVIAQIDRRLAQEAPGALAGKIMEATLVLAGLRLDDDEINDLRGSLQTVNITTESSYYRVAVAEGLKEGLMQGLKEGLMQGKIEEARRLILRQGQIRVGSPAESDRETIEAIRDLDRLEQLSERLLAVSSWAELLAETGDEGPTAP